MRKYVAACAVAAALISGAVVIQVKFKVQEKREEVQSLARQIEADARALRTLKAEWAYLTTPARLQRQSIDFLALMPTSPSQVATSVRQIPFRLNPDELVSPPSSILRPTVAKPEDKNTDKDRAAMINAVHYTLKLKSEVVVLEEQDD